MALIKDDSERLTKIKSIFSEYLEKNKQRKTPERFTILEEIYKRDDHFDAETLYIQMKNKNYNVSRATVYNTLELLVASSLVTKHQFGENSARYEKSYGYGQHDHIILTDKGQVLEFCDPRIENIKATLEEVFNIKIHNHSLNFYATSNEESEN